MTTTNKPADPKPVETFADGVICKEHDGPIFQVTDFRKFEITEIPPAHWSLRGDGSFTNRNNNYAGAASWWTTRRGAERSAALKAAEALSEHCSHCRGEVIAIIAQGFNEDDAEGSA